MVSLSLTRILSNFHRQLQLVTEILDQAKQLFSTRPLNHFSFSIQIFIIITQCLFFNPMAQKCYPVLCTATYAMQCPILGLVLHSSACTTKNGDKHRPCKPSRLLPTVSYPGDICNTVSYPGGGSPLFRLHYKNRG